MYKKIILYINKMSFETFSASFHHDISKFVNVSPPSSSSVNLRKSSKGVASLRLTAER